MRRVGTIPLAIIVALLLVVVGLSAWAIGVGMDDDDGWHMDGVGMDGVGTGMMGVGAGEPVSDIGEAERRAEGFADRLDLEVGEVMRFTNGYYAQLHETDGDPATEVLVDPETGAVWFEYGPAMMWNTRYGMMGDADVRGMFGGRGSMMGGTDRPGWTMGGPRGPEPEASGPVPERPLDADEAAERAEAWLSTSEDGASVEDPVAFPGYVTFHIARGGEVEGMLSVNADTGEVWNHWWHGELLAEHG